MFTTQLVLSVLFFKAFFFSLSGLFSMWRYNIDTVINNLTTCEFIDVVSFVLSFLMPHYCISCAVEMPLRPVRYRWCFSPNIRSHHLYRCSKSMESELVCEVMLLVRNVKSVMCHLRLNCFSWPTALFSVWSWMSQVIELVTCSEVEMFTRVSSWYKALPGSCSPLSRTVFVSSLNKNSTLFHMTENQHRFTKLKKKMCTLPLEHPKNITFI